MYIQNIIYVGEDLKWIFSYCNLNLNIQKILKLCCKSKPLKVLRKTNKFKKKCFLIFTSHECNQLKVLEIQERVFLHKTI